MQRPGLDRGPERRSLTEQMLLADEVVDGLRPHARGKGLALQGDWGPPAGRLSRVEEPFHLIPEYP
jgi:hypothetical protein